MTESVSPPPAAAPLHYAVLVPICPDLGSDAGWQVLYANGDLARARARAEEWAMSHAGQQAVVVQYVDHVQQVSAAKWMKP